MSKPLQTATTKPTNDLPVKSVHLTNPIMIDAGRYYFLTEHQWDMTLRDNAVYASDRCSSRKIVVFPPSICYVELKP